MGNEPETAPVAGPRARRGDVRHAGGVGDVVGLDSRLAGSPLSGRGASVTNRPLVPQSAFGRTRFEGDLPSGWDAEIYRNGELLAFAKPTGDQRYRFEDVELLYGETGSRSSFTDRRGRSGLAKK